MRRRQPNRHLGQQAPRDLPTPGSSSRMADAYPGQRSGHTTAASPPTRWRWTTWQPRHRTKYSTQWRIRNRGPRTGLHAPIGKILVSGLPSCATPPPPHGARASWLTCGTEPKTWPVALTTGGRRAGRMSRGRLPIKSPRFWV